MQVVQKFSNLKRKEWSYVLTLFLVAVVIRAIPELLAYPFPIGYDVINYYIPVITNFTNHWNITSGQFPLYVIILYLLQVSSKLDSQTVVQIAAIILYASFSISIYFIARRILKLQNTCSLFLSVFVILQISSLRTSWDLHKDMLSLTSMFFAVSLLAPKPDNSKKMLLIILLCIISVLTDRMIGLLLTASIVIYALVKRNPHNILIASITALVALVAWLQSFNEIELNTHFFSGTPAIVNHVYAPLNLIVLFILLNFLLIPAGIIGFINTREILLKISLVLSLMGTFSWIVFPNSSSSLPDRWTFIFSIIFSIFSAYGFIHVVNKKRLSKTVLIFILIPFIVIGMLYAITPNTSIYIILEPFREFAKQFELVPMKNNPISIPESVSFIDAIGQFGPVTMQYNSVSIPESVSIIDAINWINHNTTPGSTLLIDKNWRGWAELRLRDRTFIFYENIHNSNSEQDTYILAFNGELFQNNLKWRIIPLYNNNNFSVYKLNPVPKV